MASTEVTRVHPLAIREMAEREAEYRGPYIERYKISWLWGLMTAATTKAADDGPAS